MSYQKLSFINLRSDMQVKGKLYEIFDTITIKETFRKREFVLEYAENPTYPELLKFEMIQDKCDLLNDYQKDEEVEVHFNLKGRKWTDPKGEDKYFNSLQAWRIDKVQSQPEPSFHDSKSPAEGEPSEPDWLKNGGEAEDELPF